MGRHQFRRSQRPPTQRHALFIPNYDEKWLVYDPQYPNHPCKEMSWSQAWEKDPGRDFVHRLNSKFMPRYISEGTVGVGETEAYSTMAIILCFVIVACIIVPQIFQIFSALFFSKSRRPPTPPSPPQIPKTRKRLRLYYFRKNLASKKIPPPTTAPKPTTTQ